MPKDKCICKKEVKKVAKIVEEKTTVRKKGK